MKPLAFVIPALVACVIAASLAPCRPAPEMAGSPGAVVTLPPNEEQPRLGDYVYVTELPEPITRVPPSYPEEARKKGVSGTVMVQVLVSREGTVADTRVVKSIPGLDEAAVTAVQQWRFKPARGDKGQPVAVWVAAPVKFSLH